MTNNLNPVVIVKDNQTFANSRHVAVFFGKRHADVLRDIHRTSENLTDANLRWFSFEDYLDAKGERRVSYDMTKDGFTLLVMGYTGQKAMQFKLRYIEEFNRMEQTLKVQTKLPTTFADALRLAADQAETITKLEENRPKVEA